METLLYTTKDIRRIRAVVMANARRIIKAKKATSNALLFSQLFGSGLSSARNYCEYKLGLCAESNVTDLSEMISFIEGNTDVC